MNFDTLGADYLNIQQKYLSHMWKLTQHIMFVVYSVRKESEAPPGRQGLQEKPLLSLDNGKGKLSPDLTCVHLSLITCLCLIKSCVEMLKTAKRNLFFKNVKLYNLLLKLSLVQVLWHSVVCLLKHLNFLQHFCHIFLNRGHGAVQKGYGYISCCVP